MVPTMWLFGAVVGRWWAIPVGAIIWALLIVLAVQSNMGDLGLAAVVGAANTAVGVALRQIVRGVGRLFARMIRAASA